MKSLPYKKILALLLINGFAVACLQDAGEIGDVVLDDVGDVELRIPDVVVRDVFASLHDAGAADVRVKDAQILDASFSNDVDGPDVSYFDVHRPDALFADVEVRDVATSADVRPARQDLVIAPRVAPDEWISPQRWFDQYEDGEAVSVLYNFGLSSKPAVQNIASRQPIFAFPCEPNGADAAGRACLKFDSGQTKVMLVTPLANKGRQVMVAGVFRSAHSGTEIAFDANDSSALYRLGANSSGMGFHNLGNGNRTNSTAAGASDLRFLCSYQDGDTTTLQMNGEIVSQTVAGQSELGAFAIGNSVPFGFPLRGTIDDIKVWNSPGEYDCDAYYNEFVRASIADFDVGPNAPVNLENAFYEDCARPVDSVCPQSGVCRLLQIGDSIVAGTNETIDTREGVFEELFDQLGKPSCYERIKLAVSGTRAFTFMQAQYEVRPPMDYDVLLMHGPTNDLSDTSGFESCDYYKEIARRAKSDGMKVVITLTHPQSTQMFFSQVYEDRRQEFIQCMNEWDESDVFVVSTESLGDGTISPAIRPEFDFGDGKHLNNAGERAHAALIEALFE